MSSALAEASSSFVSYCVVSTKNGKWGRNSSTHHTTLHDVKLESSYSCFVASLLCVEVKETVGVDGELSRSRVDCSLPKLVVLTTAPRPRPQQAGSTNVIWKISVQSSEGIIYRSSYSRVCTCITNLALLLGARYNGLYHPHKYINSMEDLRGSIIHCIFVPQISWSNIYGASCWPCRCCSNRTACMSASGREEHPKHHEMHAQ